MKALKVLLFTLLLNSWTALAQSRAPISAGVDVAGGLAPHSWTPSVSYHEEIGSYKMPWLRFGLGFRAWGYYAGQSVLSSKTIHDQKENLIFEHVSANGLSFLTGVTLAFGKFEIGANTDIAGASMGSKRHGFYPKPAGSSGNGAQYYNQKLPARPSVINILPLALVRSNGQSEVFVRVRLNNQIGLKAGYVHGRVNYSVTNFKGVKIKLDNEQRQVSRVYGLAQAGVMFVIND